MITLIDYGAGNLHSLQGGLKRLGFDSRRAVTPADAAASGTLVLPGVARLLGPGVKVPNMGWGKVRTVHPHPALPACADEWLYFVHSYALDPDPETVLESTHGRPFSAVQARGRVLGFQGHPEKSGAFGEALLRGVLGWLGEVPCA